MCAIILANTAIMVFETNQDAMCYPEFEGREDSCTHHSSNIAWLSGMNLVFLIIYTVEASLRLYAERTAFFFNRWNQIDCLLVLLGWLASYAFAFLNVTFLRSFRIARLLRAARVLTSIREFYLLMSGFMSSVRAIFFGALGLLSALLFWSIFVVQVIHPINASIYYRECERCSGGFKNVQSAIVTLVQQIVAGDSWGQISVPIIEKAPWTFPILFSILVSISLGVMNLILAVIVERSTEARENDIAAKIKRKEQCRMRNMIELAKVCHDMDEDGSGTLSLDEMMNGCDTSSAFKDLMALLDLHKEDMASIFKSLDEDGSGDVSYLEFCQNIDKASKRDTQIMVSLIKLSLSEIKTIMQKEVIACLNRICEDVTLQSSSLQQHGQLLSRMFAHIVPVWQSPESELAGCAIGPLSGKETRSAELSTSTYADATGACLAASDLTQLLEGLSSTFGMLDSERHGYATQLARAEQQLAELQGHATHLMLEDVTGSVIEVCAQIQLQLNRCMDKELRALRAMWRMNVKLCELLPAGASLGCDSSLQMKSCRITPQHEESDEAKPSLSPNPQGDSWAVRV
eukprot:TRINITY_DN11613_c0_g1_i1.p1 TRINITY_DN11613_c0_g1~~TRINITY_DN11613_c0_g1_i1.p1  ORF type:complete len:590 (+),score=87.05 TRINITY_DN11613_c0_g1_i1:49-1770(+)